MTNIEVGGKDPSSIAAFKGWLSTTSYKLHVIILYSGAW